MTRGAVSGGVTRASGAKPGDRARTPGAATNGRLDALRETLAGSRLTAPLRRAWSGRGSCLMYHRICTDDQAFDEGFAPNRELSVRVGAFDQQMRFLAANCNCLALGDAVALLKAGRLPPRSVVVTFDDGYLDNLTLALPVLRRYGIPATVYVTTGLVERKTELWWYDLEAIIRSTEALHIDWQGVIRVENTRTPAQKRLCYQRLNRVLKRLQPDEQRALMRAVRGTTRPPLAYANDVLDRGSLAALAGDPLITIGAHTDHHPALSRLPRMQLEHEMTVSRDKLERWTGRRVEHFAFPFGGREHAGKREFSAARETGFTSAVTTRLGHLLPMHASHLHALPRVAVGYHDTLTRLEFKLSGLDCLIRRPLAHVMV